MQRAGGFVVAIEPLARSFGYPVAQHVAELWAVGLTLLAQFFDPHGVAANSSIGGQPSDVKGHDLLRVYVQGRPGLVPRPDDGRCGTGHRSPAR